MQIPIRTDLIHIFSVSLFRFDSDFCFSTTLRLIFYSTAWQICEIEPSFFKDCDPLARKLQGRLDILSVSMHEGDTHVDHYDDHEDAPSSLSKESADSVPQLTEKIQKQTLSTGNENAKGEVKQNKCSTCNALVGDAQQYRDHFKSDWHKHNLKRKTRKLPPLSAEECFADSEIGDSRADLKYYSF